MTSYIPIGGTHDFVPHGKVRAWCERGSVFEGQMRGQGCVALVPPTYPLWSTAVNGVIWSRGNRAWWHGAAIVADWLLQLDPKDRNLIALSHGGQVALLAAATLERVTRHDTVRLVTVGTPHRRDLRQYYGLGLDRWWHLYSTGWENRMQTAGQLFDRHVSLSYRMPAPARNVRIEGTGHSDIVKKPEAFHHLVDCGALAMLKAER